MTLTAETAPDAGTDEFETSTTAEPDETEPTGRFARIRRAARGRALPVTAAVLAAASLVTAGATYQYVYRADQSVDDTAKGEVIASANDGAVALLSYSPDSLDADFAAAKSHLTGQFLTYYNEFTEKVVKPAATENGVDTQAQIVRSAVSTIDAEDAVVLAFVNQTTTNKNAPEPELTSSSVRISLHKDDGVWRISSFDPV